MTNLNQIDTRPDSGKMLIMGQLDEPADVAVATNSNPAVNADVDINHVFKAYADVIDGSNTLTVTATDKSGNSNQTSTNYSFSVSADTFTDPVYDADGNMLQDGTGRSYVWDQESRLTRINCPSGEYTTFAYNAFSQRIRKTEYNSLGTPTSDIAYIWCGGTQPCESRDFNTQTTVLVRYYPQGEERIGGADAGDYYYFQDHLGSVSEMVDSSENVRAQYEYDPYGRQSANLITTNPLESQFGYTGHFNHSESGLVLTWYRAYDPELGIWLSRDPIAENGGINLYGYVGSNPLNAWDPFGLVDINKVPRPWNPDPSDPHYNLWKGADEWNLDDHVSIAAHLSQITDGSVNLDDLAKETIGHDKYDGEKPVVFAVCQGAWDDGDGTSPAENFASLLKFLHNQKFPGLPFPGVLSNTGNLTFIPSTSTIDLNSGKPGPTKPPRLTTHDSKPGKWFISR